MYATIILSTAVVYLLFSTYRLRLRQEKLKEAIGGLDELATQLLETAAVTSESADELSEAIEDHVEDFQVFQHDVLKFMSLVQTFMNVLKPKSKAFLAKPKKEEKKN